MQIIFPLSIAHSITFLIFLISTTCVRQFLQKAVDPVTYLALIELCNSVNFEEKNYNFVYSWTSISVWICCVAIWIEKNWKKSKKIEKNEKNFLKFKKLLNNVQNCCVVQQNILLCTTQQFFSVVLTQQITTDSFCCTHTRENLLYNRFKHWPQYSNTLSPVPDGCCQCKGTLI
jgi:hypothetical protein